VATQGQKDYRSGGNKLKDASKQDRGIGEGTRELSSSMEKENHNNGGMGRKGGKGGWILQLPTQQVA